MYINPFFAGVLATVCVEVLCSFIYALQHNNQGTPEKIVAVDLTKDEMREMLEKLQETMNGKNNDNQGE